MENIDYLPSFSKNIKFCTENIEIINFLVSTRRNKAIEKSRNFLDRIEIKLSGGYKLARKWIFLRELILWIYISKRYEMIEIIHGSKAIFFIVQGSEQWTAVITTQGYFL